MNWKMSNAAKYVSMTTSNEDDVRSFEHHMRTYQHADDSSTHKQHANAANASDNAAKEKPYCNWCYKEKGAKRPYNDDNSQDLVPMYTYL